MDLNECNYGLRGTTGSCRLFCVCFFANLNMRLRVKNNFKLEKKLKRYSVANGRGMLCLERRPVMEFFRFY